MGAMKDFYRRIRQGGDDAIAAVEEYVAEQERLVAQVESMLQRACDRHWKEWIPVGEKLPDERVKVLTCGDDPVEGPFTLIGLREPASIFGPAHWHLPGFSEFGPVTHWQPLPSPPEVE
jgi:hypothetical protein